MQFDSRPSRVLSTSGARTPAAHTTSSAGMNAPVASRIPVSRTSAYFRRGPHADAEILKQFRRGFRQSLRQRWQDAIGRLDELDLDILFGIDPVEAVNDELARSVVQLCRELRSGGTSANDRNIELFRS